MNRALKLADDGDVIALARGTYEGAVFVDEAVLLWGACVAETVLISSEQDDERATLRLLAAGAGVRNLTVTGERPGIAAASLGGGTVTVRNVLVDGARAAGLLVLSDMDAANLVVRGTRSGIARGLGTGIEVQSATLHLERAVLDGNRGIGLRVQVTDQRQAGLTVSDLAIVGTLPAQLSTTMGLAVVGASTASVTRAAIMGSPGAMVLVYGGGAELAMSDAVLVDARSTEHRFALPLFVSDGGQATLNRVSVDGSTDGGAQVAFGSRLQATDFVLRDCESGGGEEHDVDAISVVDASLTLERAALLRNHRSAITVDQGGDLHARDVLVRDTGARPFDGIAGFGIQVGQDATAEVDRVAVVRSGQCGILVSYGSSLTGFDLAIRDTRSRESDGTFGDGLYVEGGNVSLERVESTGNRRYGVLALDPEAVVTLTDLLVSDTRSESCSIDDCEEPGGIGIGTGGRLDVRRFVVRDDTLCGIQVLEGGAADLHQGLVAGHPIGANVQDEAFDVLRLQDDVRYTDNGRSLDTRSIPVPSGIPPLDSATPF